MKILVVDDDHQILKLTQKFLELNDYNVECCDNALEAIQKLGDFSFDILITDATMPAYSGFDLVRTIRKTPELSYLTIAMLTGLSEKADIERALNLGVQDYIVKPLSPEIFLQKTEKLIQIHKAKKVQKPVRIQTNADMLVPVKVSRITDIGVTLLSPYPLAKGTHVTIHLDSLKTHGIEHSEFKALYSNPPSENGKAVTELLLLNATPEEQKTLAKLASSPANKKAS